MIREPYDPEILCAPYFASLSAFLVLTGCGIRQPYRNDGNDDPYLSLSVSAGVPLSRCRSTDDLNYSVNVQTP
jgi:hypothetical protein